MLGRGVRRDFTEAVAWFNLAADQKIEDAAAARDAVAARIRWRPDPEIQKIVSGWPMRFAADRGRALGFAADESVEKIIQAFIDDELGGAHVP